MSMNTKNRMFNTILIGSLPSCSVLIEELRITTNLLAIFLNDTSYKYFDANAYDVPIYTHKKKELTERLPKLLKEKEIDFVLVCGLGHKIPQTTLTLPKYGFINVHFGRLPENRGANPVFWTLKKGTKETAISVHKMDDNWDTGMLLLQKKVPVILGETYGMLMSKLTLQCQGIVKNVLERIKDTSKYTEQPSETAKYNPKPKGHRLFIDWENQTADEIEFLVNACNPSYAGAGTYYQGGEIRFIEVVRVSSQAPLLGRVSGEIIHAHPQEGLFVVCKFGQLLKLNVLSSDAGVLSGMKYVNLGMCVGQRFTTLITAQDTVLNKSY